ncbi:hypothetical protein [Rhizobium sp. LjRoot254]|uniref:hypothetical protein n=1 Tax=Rhizobium sp. LjRoot254 TaxID=3342297 RepID=UPI003ECDA9FB
MIPLLDPANTVVMNANGGNVEAVMVAGQFVKRDGRILNTDLDKLARELAGSSERLMAEFRQIGQKLT